ncbi:NrfD/PsrC family molybdoenzyme membrane anchor subunit [Stetteria hydrogenophila]
MGRTLRLALWAIAAVLTILMVVGIAEYRAETGDEAAVYPAGTMLLGYTFFALMSGGINDSALICAYILGKPEEYRGLRRDLLTALAVLIPGVVLIFSEIAHPEHAQWLYLGFNVESRIAWNAVLYIVYGLFLIALLLYLIVRGEEAAGTPAAKTLAFLALAASLILEANLGMAYGANVSILPWFGVFSSMLTVAAAFALGAAWLALTGRIRLEGVLAGEEAEKWCRKCAKELIITLTALAYVILWGLVGLYSWGMTKDYVSIVVSGELASYFWLGYVLVGTIIPIAIAVAAAKGRARTALPLAGVLAVIGIAAFLLVPYNYGAQYFRATTNEFYATLAAKLGVAEEYTVSHYLTGPETLAFIGGFGLALLLDLIGESLLPLKPGEKPRRLWILK